MSASAEGWSARLVSTAGDETWIDDALLSVSIEPEHSALWDAEIELAPVIDPRDYDFGAFDCFYEGSAELRCTIDDADLADDGTVTLTGRERNGMALVEEDIDITLAGRRIPNAIQEVWDDHTGYSATVHAPSTGRVTDELVQAASTPADFDQLLQARTRDEQGRYLDEEDGSAPNFQPTDPFVISDQGVELAQSCFFREGESFDSSTSNVLIEDRPINDWQQADADEYASGEQIATLQNSDDSVTFSFTTAYDIPDFAIRARWRSDGNHAEDTVGVDIDDSTLKTTATFNVVPYGDQFAWSDVSEFRKDDTLQAGDHTVTIGKIAGDDNIYLDCLAMFDRRFSYRFHNRVDSNGALDGPQLYPDGAEFELADIEPGFDADAFRVTTGIDAVTAASQVSLFVSGDGTLTRGIASSAEESLFTTGQTVPRAFVIAHLDRRGERTGTTPTQGFESQVLESIEVRVSGDAVPVIDRTGRDLQGSELDVLQTLHDDAGYIFTTEHGRSDGAKVAESFERGDPARSRQLFGTDTGASAVTDRSRETSTEGYANRVRVVGAEYPRGIRRSDDPRNYDAVVEDSEEIADNGVEAITIEDDSLETHNDVRSKARAELRKRLRADSHGGSIGTLPRIVEPGYPYLVPVLGPHDIDLPACGDVPAGTTEAITDGEHCITRTDITIDGTLTIESGGRLTVAATGSVTVSDTGSLTVAEGGTLTAEDGEDERFTCESWSFGESSGSADASGEFGVVGGVGGRDRAGLLGLLAGD